ncbi:sorting nexin-14-like [Oppia nitens]|uniref:sorting nexin-14-like n=1 Tax=Oppia nitens TaxID=1686743 RepID=UPI0023DA5124|nr:sorting nexin-14-like [Oppia nitens]
MKRSKFETILLTILSIIVVIVILNIVLMGFWTSFVLIVMFSIGFLSIQSLVKKSSDLANVWLNSCDNISENICKNLIAKLSKTSHICLICGDISCERHDSRLSVNVKPFKGLMIDKKIDESIDEILELTLNRFVNLYLDDISINVKQLNVQLRHILRTLLAAIIRRSLNVNISDILLEELPRVLCHHLETYMAGKRCARNAQCIEESVLREYRHMIHPAMNSREEEIKYLQSIVDKILPHLLPPKYMNCKVVDCFFKEVIACSVLLPMMDICGDPDKINELFIILFDKNESAVNYNRNNCENMVEILDTFVGENDGKLVSNNLGIDLKRILSDQQLLFLFQQFSKEEGFINLVQFILHINSFSQRILNPDLNEEQLKSLHIEAINIFNLYFLPNSMDYIKFSDYIYNGFKSVIDGKPEDVERLRTTEPLYHAYDYIYNLLETHYCQLFLESDLYFKLICGQRWTSFEGLSPNKVKNITKTLDSHSVSSDSISWYNRFDGSQDSLDDVFNQITQEYDSSSQIRAEINGWTEFSNADRIKDISSWRVSVPKVISRIDSTNGREYDVFLINIQRLDLCEKEIDMSWTVERRYNEFYVLESKLKEFHGENLSEICLPPKRSFIKLNKPFMESRRPEMEKFIQQLMSSSHLKGSELVYNFLKSEEEFTTGFLSDIRFGKMIRTVPAKFAKERGQHLEPFLQSFIASTEQIKPKPLQNDISELLEYSPHEFAMTNLHRPLYQFMDQWKESEQHFNSEIDPKRVHSQLFYVYDYLLFLLMRFYNINEFILKILFTLRPVLRKTIQSFSEWYLKWKLKNSLLIPQRIVNLIFILRNSLYFESHLPQRTSQQKKQRSQMTLKYAKEFVPKWLIVNVLGKDKHEEVVYLFYSIFQYPLLNKQLLYIIFDIILKHLFPEILLSNNINTSLQSNNAN